MIRKVLRGIRWVVMGIFIAGIFVPIAVVVVMMNIIDKILEELDKRVNSEQKKC